MNLNDWQINNAYKHAKLYPTQNPLTSNLCVSVRPSIYFWTKSVDQYEILGQIMVYLETHIICYSWFCVGIYLAWIIVTILTYQKRYRLASKFSHFVVQRGGSKCFGSLKWLRSFKVWNVVINHLIIISVHEIIGHSNFHPR